MKEKKMSNSWKIVVIFWILAMPNAGAMAQDTLWVITTDYSLFGRVRSMDNAVPWTVSGDLATIPGDAVGREHGGLIYIVGRGGANLVQVFDPSASFSLVREFSLGDGRNPQDIAFAPDGSAYVSCYDEAVLLQVDPATGNILATFSTASYADSDGRPETAWIEIHQNKLYITCQLLDRGGGYAPVGPGKILVFDLNEQAWLPAIELEGADPYTKLRFFEDDDGNPKMAVGCVGYFAMLDGGVEVVDLDTGQSDGYLATETELGGDVLNFVFTGDDQFHALVSNSSFATSIVKMDTGSGLISVTASSSGYDHADLAFDGGFQLFVADRRTGVAGVRVFDVASNQELTSSPLATGLPPFLFIMPDNSGVSSTGDLPQSGFQLGSPYPNPCNPTATIQIQGAPFQKLQLSVFDLKGRRVQAEVLVLNESGTASFTFKGRQADGRNLPAGVYRVAAQGPNVFAAKSLVLVK